MHEVAPYDNFSMTYGLCGNCHAAHPGQFSHEVIEHAHFIRKILRTLRDAGRREDFETACRVVDEAISSKCRPTDILIGILSPLLYEVGEEWKRGVLSVEAEQRFTAFSEKVIELVETRIGAEPSSLVPANTTLFLMNAPGNRHLLALRVISLWLKDRGAEVRIVPDGIDQNELLQCIAAERPKYLLISMATLNQRAHVTEIAKRVLSLHQDVRPKIVVGGYPVKTAIIDAIPGAELLSNIDALHLV